MKILLIYASAGAGHFKAAQAIYNKLFDENKHEVVLLDALDRTTPWFKNVYRETYALLISKISWLWHLFFILLDIPVLQPFYALMHRVHNAVFAGNLHHYLKEQQFDVIISTHFMSSEVVGGLKAKGAIRSKLVAVITDYDVHHIWLAKGIDLYCVACEFTKKRLLSFGVAADKIKVTGIPTDEKFNTSWDVRELKKKLGLQQDTFTVLVATGSFGFGPIEDLVAQLKGMQVIIVCGHNKNLFHRLSQKKSALVKPYGLVNNMYELMAASNCMVTKPGGLSITEALVTQLPLVFFNPIPGQETNNVKVLAQYGVGKMKKNVADIAHEVETLRSSRDTYMTALRSTKALARPNAVNDIINAIS